MTDSGYGDFEFERRFFVDELPLALLAEPDPVLILQSYLVAADGYALRLRLQAGGVLLDTTAPLDEDDVLETYASQFDFCAITVKGPPNGGTRYEAEREIDVSVGVELVRRGGARILKNRYATWIDSDGWVVDVFGGRNRGLIIAECERGTPVTNLAIPSFCATEVTEDRRFANENLSHEPYPQWRHRFLAERAEHGPHFAQGFGTNTRATDDL